MNIHKNILSFAQITEELILNAVDAQATDISISFEWNSTSVRVEDNGCGMSCEDLEMIGFESKNPCIETIQEIIRNQVLFNFSDQQTESVCNYHQPPEKCRICSHERNIKSNKQDYANFKLVDSEKHAVLYKTRKKQDTLEAAKQIFHVTEENRLVQLRKSSQHFKIRGLVIHTSHACRPVLFANNRPVSSSKIYDLIDHHLGFDHAEQHLTVIMNIKSPRHRYSIVSKWNETTVEYRHLEELLQLVTKALVSAKKRLQTVPNKTLALQGRSVYFSSQDNSINENNVDDSRCSEKITLSKYFPASEISSPSLLDSWVRIRQKLPPDSGQLCPPSPQFGKIAYLSLSPHQILEDVRSFQSPHHINEEVHFTAESLMEDWTDDPRKRTVSEDNCAVKTRILIDSETSYKASRVQQIGLDHWIKVQDGDTEYFMNTLSGHTSTVEPTDTNPIFELRTRIRTRSVDVERLDVPNEFFVQHPNPLNIAKTAHNSFAFQIASSHHKCHLNRDTFASVYVVNQIDRKFIACLTKDIQGIKYLILVDQHAAHERICLEKLIDLHTKQEQDGVVCIRCSPLPSPLELTLSPDQVVMVEALAPEWSRLGLQLSVKVPSTVQITQVPSCFVERINEVKLDAISQRLSELIQESLAEFAKNGRLSSCLIPPTIRTALNSMACHGAIKFGDVLSRKSCIQLVRALKRCQVPFQCAHGRPLLVPLIRLDDLDTFDIHLRRNRPQYQRLLEERD